MFVRGRFSYILGTYIFFSVYLVYLGMNETNGTKSGTTMLKIYTGNGYMSMELN